MRTRIEGDGYWIFVRTQGGGGSVDSSLWDELPDEEEASAIVMLERLVLAHACAGVDITSAAYIEGLNTVVNTIFQ